jgi:hypothetical protein
MTAFYETKGWYKSKTIWTALVGILVSIASLFGFTVGADAPTIVSSVSAALFALTALFRVQATQEVTVVAPAS